MPRGKRKKKKKASAAKNKPASRTKDSVSIGGHDFETYGLDVETYGLDRAHSFMKARDDIIALSYVVPTANLAKDGLVAKYRGELIAAIQNRGRNRGQIISTQHISIDVLPMGPEAIIKAWALMKDVEGKVRGRDSDPKDPMDWKVEGVQI